VSDNSVKHSGALLSDFFKAHQACNEALVLATVAHTIGSTYRKAGAQMLIAADGSAAGLLSGGCLEADLMERTSSVLRTGKPMVVEYDTRSTDDVLWGIGLGCEGAMEILLTRLDAQNRYQPFAFAEHCRQAHRAARFAQVIASSNSAYSLGSWYLPEDVSNLPAAVTQALAPSAVPEHMRTAGQLVAQPIDAQGATFLIVPIELPLQLLVLGAGPDVMPLVEIAGLMGWHVTVLDHRPAYAVPQRFPRARRVHSRAARELDAELQLTQFDAAVVMSHHLTSDEAYLAALAASTVPYVGLLGPAPRRARLLNDIGEQARHLQDRLHGPIGLDIGAKTPETIALAIVSEIQAVLAGRIGQFFRNGAPQS
jgi:xanthine/CO dehydrogenase XdhC/CoxF family maturation factor